MAPVNAPALMSEQFALEETVTRTVFLRSGEDGLPNDVAITAAGGAAEWLTRYKGPTSGSAILASRVAHRLEALDTEWLYDGLHRGPGLAVVPRAPISRSFERGYTMKTCVSLPDIAAAANCYLGCLRPSPTVTQSLQERLGPHPLKEVVVATFGIGLTITQVDTAFGCFPHAGRDLNVTDGPITDVKQRGGLLNRVFRGRFDKDASDFRNDGLIILTVDISGVHEN